MKLEPVKGRGGRPTRWPEFRKEALALHAGHALQCPPKMSAHTEQYIAAALTRASEGLTIYKHRVVNGQLWIERLR